MPRVKNTPPKLMKGAVCGYLGSRYKKGTIKSLADAKTSLAQSSFSNKIPAKTLELFVEEWWNTRDATSKPAVAKTPEKKTLRKVPRRSAVQSLVAGIQPTVPVLAAPPVKEESDAITLQDLLAVQRLQAHLGADLSTAYLQPIVSAVDALGGVKRALEVHQALEKLQNGAQSPHTSKSGRRRNKPVPSRAD